MPGSLRNHLFLNSLVILALGMGVAGVLAWRAVEAAYIDTQRENLLAQAELSAAALQSQPLPPSSGEPYSQAANVLPGIHTRLVGTQGAVILSLPIPDGRAALQVPAVENTPSITPTELLQRPEISQALGGQPATAIRRVATARNRRVLYAAAPITGPDGSVSGLVYIAMPLPVGGAPPSLLLELVGALFLAICLALVAGSILARRITRPVEGIAQAATAVSAGQLRQYVPTTTRINELDSLGRAFNNMTENLHRSDQAKTAFIADVTHELRTPLTVIKGTIETLEDGAVDDLTGRGPLLASMQRETQRLIRLVNDLLVLTRADAGTLDLHLQPIDLAELARARCDYLAPLAAQRQVSLKVTISGGASTCIMGDEDRLAQVLDNLLDNALRFSPPGACVEVAIRQEGDECICTVHDSGPGISPEHLPFIFERFYRADASRARHSGGAGLGLAIAKALIQAHGGRISAESVPNQGATLLLTLPLRGDCHQAA
jgi:signal transduction histidine kinase